MSSIAKEAAIFIADNAAQALFGIPIDLRPYGIAAFAATYQTANAPGVPFNPFQIGPYQYQPNWDWQRSDWDGSDWVPRSGVLAEDDIKKILDNGRQKLLDMSDAERQAVEQAFRDALPLSGDFGLPDSVSLGVNGCYGDAKNWRQPVDPLMLDLDGDGLELKRADGSILFDHNADRPACRVPKTSSPCAAHWHSARFQFLQLRFVESCALIAISAALD